MNGFTIYPGRLDNANTFRIANIGDITSDDIVSFETLHEQYFSDIKKRGNAQNI
jgi:2-aminoethylphosphonate-pyruvate transaminase